MWTQRGPSVCSHMEKDPIEPEHDRLGKYKKKHDRFPKPP